MKLLVFLSAASALFALPQGADIQSGIVALEESRHALALVLAQEKTIVNWDSFSIGKGEQVSIQMPSPSSSMLNRVVGGELSELYGTLLSNGHIWLINPAGILIGKEAVIDTGSFLASTFAVLDRDFLTGIMEFQGERGKICHLGTIRSPYGKVHLLAKEIEVEGRIEAGSVETAYFFSSGESLIAFDPDRRREHPYAHAIRMTGDIEAKQVHLFADMIEVEGTIVAPGGEILIGGDVKGENKTAPRSFRTIVEKDSYLDVSGSGDGGRVVVWSDGVTHFAGEINARGGEIGGNGGFVEVSGRQLNFIGVADRTAPFGEAGTLLLDPYNVVISSGMDTNITGASPFTPTNTPSILNVTTLTTALSGGPVIVSTDVMGGAELGSITVSDPITSVSNNSLTFQAVGPIVINQPISIGGTINFEATGNTVGDYTGLTVSANITSTNGSITLTGTGNGTAADLHGVHLLSGAVTTGSGNITITGTSAPTTMNSSHGVYIQTGSASTVSGNIEISGEVAIGTTGFQCRGVQIDNPNGVTSSSGNITISGTSGGAALGAYEAGVLLFAGLTAGTTGELRFENCIGGSSFLAVGFTNFGPVTTQGDIVAVNIQGGTGSTSSGFYQLASISSTGGGNISITATSQGVGSSQHGITIEAGVLSTTGSGTITLHGTASPNATAVANGINIVDATISAGSGTVLLTGIIPMGASLSDSAGIFLGEPNSIQGTGNITLVGTNNSSGSRSHGISVTEDWTTGSPGTVTLTGTAGSGINSYPIFLDATIITTGNLIFNSAASATLTDILLRSTGGNLTFQELTSSSNITLQPSGNTTAGPSGSLNPSGRLFLNGTVTATGNVTLGPQTARTALANIATIVATNGLEITAGGNLTIQQYETVTVFGDLLFTVGGNSAFADLIATGSLTVNTTGTNTVLLRDSGFIYDSFGSLYEDDTVNILATQNDPNSSISPSVGGSGALLLQLPLSTMEFEALLEFSGDVLTYDPLTAPPAPPPSSPSLQNRDEIIFNTLVAVSEMLEYRLPLWKYTLPTATSCLSCSSMDEFFLSFMIESKEWNKTSTSSDTEKPNGASRGVTQE